MLVHYVTTVCSGRVRIVYGGWFWAVSDLRDALGDADAAASRDRPPLRNVATDEPEAGFKTQ